MRHLQDSNKKIKKFLKKYKKENWRKFSMFLKFFDYKKWPCIQRQFTNKVSLKILRRINYNFYLKKNIRYRVFIQTLKILPKIFKSSKTSKNPLNFFITKILSKIIQIKYNLKIIYFNCLKKCQSDWYQEVFTDSLSFPFEFSSQFFINKSFLLTCKPYTIHLTAQSHEHAHG